MMSTLESLQKAIDDLREANCNKDELKNLIEQLKVILPEYYPKPLSTKEICEKYQLSSRTISRLVAAGKLTPISNHGKYLFNEKDILNIK